jgi:hemin uptake protein HemP
MDNDSSQPGSGKDEVGSGARQLAGALAPVRLDSATLFAAGREVAIAHAGDIYRLRLTRQNRLILTK